MAERAMLGVDGDCGFALLGENIQEGDAEFVEIAPLVHKDDWTDHHARLRASMRAFRILEKRHPGISFWFGPSHPYGR